MPTPLSGTAAYTYTMVPMEPVGEPDIDMGFAQFDPTPQTNGVTMDEPGVGEVVMDTPMIDAPAVDAPAEDAAADPAPAVEIPSANAEELDGSVAKKKRGRPSRQSLAAAEAAPVDKKVEEVVSAAASPAATPASAPAEESDSEFGGLTFQAAQEKIMTDLLNYESEP